METRDFVNINYLITRISTEAETIEDMEHLLKSELSAYHRLTNLVGSNEHIRLFTEPTKLVNL